MNRLIRWTGALAVLCLSAMVLVLVATLVLRPLGILVPSSEILVSFLMVGMAFFGLAYTYAAGAHVRVDALYKRMPARAQQGVGVLSQAGGAVLCAAIAVYSADLTWMAYRFNDLSDGLVAVPMWIPLCTVPVGFGLLALALARDGLRILRGQTVCFAVSEQDGAAALACDAPRDAS